MLYLLLGFLPMDAHAIHPAEGIDNNIYNAIFIEDYYAKKKAALKEWAAKLGEQENFKDAPVKMCCDGCFKGM